MQEGSLDRAPIWDDIRTLNTGDSEIHGHIDIIFGGFPCQDISVAGLQKGIQQGTRSGLLYEVERIVQHNTPKYLLMENVKNLVSHDGGVTWVTIQQKLNNLGYEIRWKIIDAKFWVPQHRERIYIVAFRRKSFTKKEIASFNFPKLVLNFLRL